jgi:hypothetical protein
MTKARKLPPYKASVVFRSQPIPPHDKVEDFDRFGILLKESRKFCKRVGLRQDLIMQIMKTDTDWAFILKIDALLESAAKHVIHHGVRIQYLSRTLRSEALDDFIDGLPMNGRTSLLMLLEASALPDEELRFVEITRLVRNAYAHDIRFADLRLIELIKSRNDKSRLIKYLSAIRTYDEASLIASFEKGPMFLRFCIIDSAMRFLFYAYHLTTKRKPTKRNGKGA